MTAFKTLQSAHALRIIQDRRAGVDIDVSGFETPVGIGDLDEESQFVEIADKIEAVMHELDNLSTLQRNLRFDSAVSTLLHQDLAIDSKMASMPDFWIWLAVAYLSVAVEWRTKTNNDFANFQNYGIGSRWRNLVARLWYRAELSKVDEGDPYVLSRRGQIDFWESGVIRHRYSSCRQLTRAFVRFQYPDLDQPYKPFLDLTHPNGVRMLYRRLRRMQTTIVYEALSDESANEFIAELACDLTRSEASHN